MAFNFSPDMFVKADQAELARYGITINDNVVLIESGKLIEAAGVTGIDDIEMFEEMMTLMFTKYFPQYKVEFMRGTVN